MPANLPSNATGSSAAAARHACRHHRQRTQQYLMQVQMNRNLYHYYQQHYQHQHPSAYQRLFGRNNNNNTVFNGGGSTATRREKNPFLMIKVLLFMLMIIDFVLNSIGLAVLVVLAKNHYNNLLVEQTLTSGGGGAAATRLDDPLDPIESEWSLILPLLPSFIFVEVLTLVGMFGVFCDLFSFTMAYAILKLITSLCFPSMASAAAVAAMASSTAAAAATTTQMPAHHHHHTAPMPVNLSNPFVNLTELASSRAPHHRIKINQLVWNALHNGNELYNRPRPPERTTTEAPMTPPPTTTTPPDETTTLVYTYIPLVSNYRRSETRSSQQPSTTLPPDISSFVSSPRSPVIFTSDMTTTTTSTTQTTTNRDNMLAADDASYFKHSKLKFDKKSRLKAEKLEKMAKLKAKESQLRSRLTRMEGSPYIYPGNPMPANRTSPWVTTRSEPKEGQGTRLSMILPIDPQTNNIKYHHRVWDALLVTFEVIFAVAFAFNTLTKNSSDYDDDDNGGSGGAGAYNEYYYEEESSSAAASTRGGRQGRHHRRRLRSMSNRSNAFWPYTPLPNSTDAYYFAQFQLPPPPPPYFCTTLPRQHRPAGEEATIGSATGNTTLSPSQFTAQEMSSAVSELPEGPPPVYSWRRFSPSSWFHRMSPRASTLGTTTAAAAVTATGRSQSPCCVSPSHPQPPSSATTSSSSTTTAVRRESSRGVRQRRSGANERCVDLSPPPNYEDIGRDRPVIFVTTQSQVLSSGDMNAGGVSAAPYHQPQELANATTTEGIVLQVLNPPTTSLNLSAEPIIEEETECTSSSTRPRSRLSCRSTANSGDNKLEHKVPDNAATTAAVMLGPVTTSSSSSGSSSDRAHHHHHHHQALVISINDTRV